MSRPLKSMTVGELIAALREMPEDAPVVFEYDYGDRTRTQIAGRVRRVDQDSAHWSEYHQQFAIDGESESEREESHEVVVLR